MSFTAPTGRCFCPNKRRNWTGGIMQMPRGIIVCGANGSGKSTFGRELARALRYRYMDIEDYYFKESAVPYSEPRRRVRPCFTGTLRTVRTLSFPVFWVITAIPLPGCMTVRYCCLHRLRSECGESGNGRWNGSANGCVEAATCTNRKRSSAIL